MESKFEGTWGGVFVASLVMSLLCIIPFVGFAMAYVYYQKYMIGNTVVGGKKLEFKANWKQVWVPLFVTGLLIWIPALMPLRMERLKWKFTAVIG